jgi:hypothetical protein
MKMTLPLQRRQEILQRRETLARQLKARTQLTRPRRFLRDASDDYPVGYLEQLARPLLSRTSPDRRAGGRTVRRPPPQRLAG